MNIEPIYIDIIVITLTLFSAIIGLIRGFINEVFSVIGWLAAIVVTVLLWPLSKDLLRTVLEQDIMADIITAVLIFVITLTLVTIASYTLSDKLKQSRLGIVDRTLGFGFGVARALVVLGLAYLLAAWVWEPSDRPEWLIEAKSRPVLEVSAETLAVLVPGSEEIEISAEEDTDNQLEKIMRPDKAAKALKESIDSAKDQLGYSPEERNKLQNIIEMESQPDSPDNR